jgi:hypothetical protein
MQPTKWAQRFATNSKFSRMLGTIRRAFAAGSLDGIEEYGLVKSYGSVLSCAKGPEYYLAL